MRKRLTIVLILVPMFLGMEVKNNPSESAQLNYSLIGSLGLMQFIIIPTERSKDINFHMEIVKKLCLPGETCFLNFFTNSKNAPEKFPLDDRILAEPTLMYKNSAKHRNEIMDWSCRLNLAIRSCF